MNVPGVMESVPPNPDNTIDSWWAARPLLSRQTTETCRSGAWTIWLRTLWRRSVRWPSLDKRYPTINFGYNTEDTFLHGVQVNEYIK